MIKLIPNVKLDKNSKKIRKVKDFNQNKPIYRENKSTTSCKVELNTNNGYNREDVNLELNGKIVTAKQGQTIIQVAKEKGVEMSHKA